MLVSVGETVKVQTVKNADDPVMYWVGKILAVDDHGIRLTCVQYANLDGSWNDRWESTDKDVVLTWKSISRMSVTP